jgi:hypothetical protein
MLLRLVVALGGITFLATGIGIFLTDSCRSVTWGSRGAERAGNFTATCHDAFVDGAMSQGMAGIVAMTAGLLLVLTVSVPLLRSRAAEVFNR